jgi:peptide/nickel transport system permease protein
MLGGLFPIAIGGAIVLEVIFSIPGMGWLTLEAIYARDYPVIITIVFFSGVMTLIGYLFSDIMYACFDPRIRFDDQKAVE